MHRSVSYIIGFILCLFIASSCKNGIESPNVIKEEPVAKVYNQYLYPSDIKALWKDSPALEDSAQRVNYFIESWIKKKLLLHKSYKFLPDELKEIEDRVRDYRESLVSHLYETKLLEKNLDTLVSAEAMQQLYNEHPDNFILRKSVLAARYIIINKDARNIDSIKLWFKNNDEYGRERLRAYITEYLADSQLDAKWMDISDCVIKFKIDTNSPEKYFKDNEMIQKTDLNSLYLLEVVDIEEKGKPAPMDYCAPEIQSIILKQRKNEFIKQVKNKLYEEALENNDFEIYKKE